ncbi:hypothetical protein [Prosthecobacter sp.]
MTRETAWIDVAMRLRFQCMLTCVLSLLFVTAAPAQQRFARGLLIYKSVPSDPPNYFNGVLFLSSSAGAIWKEYDIGQPKPFRITTDPLVTEIHAAAARGVCWRGGRRE